MFVKIINFNGLKLWKKKHHVTNRFGVLVFFNNFDNMV